MILIYCCRWGFPHSSVGKESTCNVGDPSSIPGWERSTGEGVGYPLQYSGLENSMDCIVPGDHKESDKSEWLSVSQGFPRWPLGKESACQCRREQETWVWSLGWKDPLEEETATHSSSLAWENSMDRGAWWATVHGVAKSWTWLKWLNTHAWIFHITKQVKSLSIWKTLQGLP